jgi:biotin operon repressor
MSVAAYATARQQSDCLHSREPFDTVFRCVAERRDISPTAKLVHGRLVSQHRLGAAWTQAEIGEALGLSRHQVWAAIQELIAAGLVVTIRYGLGRPNGYVLLGIDADSLEGRADRQQAAGQGSGSRARTYVRKEMGVRTGVYRPPENPQDYAAGRYGPLPPR